MATIEQARDASKDHSQAASNVSRQLAFAAIAMVWIFRTETVGNATPHIPGILTFAILVVALALLLDLLQYTIPTVLFSAWARKYELRGEATIKGRGWSHWLPWPGYICFFTKIVLIAIAYAVILTYLITQGILF